MLLSFLRCALGFCQRCVLWEYLKIKAFSCFNNTQASLHADWPAFLEALVYCTVRLTVAVVVIVELTASVAVTVNLYVPDVVAIVPEWLGGKVMDAPPQPMLPASTTTHSRSSMEAQRRRRDGMPIISNAARTEPPQPSPQTRICVGRAREAVEAAVVVIESTAVFTPLGVSTMFAGFTLQTGRLCAFAGELVSAQAAFTVPV
jgi:hypothetical protein